MRYKKLSHCKVTFIFSSFSSSETSLAVKEISTDSEIGFISDEFYVPLRSSPCSTCKIVHKGLKSGTKLFVYEHEEDWSLVATESGYSIIDSESFEFFIPLNRF